MNEINQILLMNELEQLRIENTNLKNENEDLVNTVNFLCNALDECKMELEKVGVI